MAFKSRWIFIGEGIWTIFIQTLIFIVTRIVLTKKASWWWFFGFLIFNIVILIISGVIVLVLKFKKIQEPKLKISPKEAVDRAIIELLEDTNNCDNFIVKDRLILNVGQEGAKKTNLLWATGRGSEKNQKVDAIINLEDPNEEISWLFNATDDKIMNEAIRLAAENPASEVKEEIVSGTDPYGRPIITTTRKSQSRAEKKEEEEKKEAMEANLM